MNYLLYATIMLFAYSGLSGQEQKKAPWTWFYQKSMTPQEIQENSYKQEISYLRDNLEPFSQLVFSWNAQRPANGYFSFWVQARDKNKKSWGMWHKMMEWGADVQRSFMTPSDNYARYLYVRLEAEQGKLSDAFRIKIKTHDGANLADLKNFSVCLSNFAAFHNESINDLQELSSIHIHKVPRYSQRILDHPRNDSLCSPTSTSMLMSYLLKEDIDPVNFAQGAYDNGLKVFGSWPFNIAHAFEVGKGNFWFAVARFNSFAHIHTWLQRNIPVVVSVRGPLAGSQSAYAQGHLLVVVGYDAKKGEVICHDPAFETNAKTKKRYAVKDFLEAWERSKRLVYIAGPMNMHQET